MRPQIKLTSMMMMVGVVWAGAFTDRLNSDLLTTLQHNGHTYHVFDDAMTWQQARDFARGVTFGDQAGYLTQIDNAAIYSLLLAHDGFFEKTASDGGGARYVWIGASDLTVEGDWRWARDLAFKGTEK